jgi:hypothetical protein
MSDFETNTEQFRTVELDEQLASIFFHGLIKKPMEIEVDTPADAARLHTAAYKADLFDIDYLDLSMVTIRVLSNGVTKSLTDAHQEAQWKAALVSMLMDMAPEGRA